jgi:hypothetical protein
LKLVRKNGFQQIEVGKFKALFLQGKFACNKAGSVVALR